MGNSTSGQSTLSRRYHEATGTNSRKDGTNRSSQSNSNNAGNPESSRVLFLLYLIHRTWNVVVDTVDQKGKRSRRASISDDSGAPRSFDERFETDLDFTDIEDDQSSLYGSQYSFCSCSYCCETDRNHFENIGRTRMSICESEFSYCLYQMAPSAGTQIGPPEMTDINMGWNQNGQMKENQRPPVYNPEDYVLSLKKYGRRGTNGAFKSIYDADDGKADKVTEMNRCNTLPAKHSDYKSPIPSPPENDGEMSLRQFGSVTDLLTKLRADLRASFPSFVQEFVAVPMDGVSLLLEVLRAVQLSQSMPIIGTGTTPPPRVNQTYHRRALLDELACLQCLSMCCSRSPEAGSRLGTTPVGLLPLAAAATGTGIRSRIFALQLLTNACDRAALGDGSNRSVNSGHNAVSEALSTLRLRCAEPVRCRLLVGMLNSGGGSGELQAVGLKFVNTFLESAENAQNRLYLQAELHQAGLEPQQMTKTISSTSPWLEKLRFEVKRWDTIKIDLDALQLQARSAEQVRSKMVILERRVQILQEEKTVLTTMERRLQERCADLQREVMRLQQGSQTSKASTLEKRPVALPRQVPPLSKRESSSEQEDEGISSSETGQSLSPEPPRVFPSKEESHNFNIDSEKIHRKPDSRDADDDDSNTTIDDVIEELQNIVSDAEREISIQNDASSNVEEIHITPEEANLYSLEVTNENEIVPVNLLPQPPRKSRSLTHLFSTPSDDIEDSDYELLVNKNDPKYAFFEEEDDIPHFQQPANEKIHKTYIDTNYYDENIDRADIIHSTHGNKVKQNIHCTQDMGTNRAILNVIMDAREKEESRMIRAQSLERDISPPQQFNGVFFMTDMNNPNKYPKPDITAALEAKRVSKNLDRMGSYGLDSMIDIVMPSGGDKRIKNSQIYLRSKTTSSMNVPAHIKAANLNSSNNKNSSTNNLNISSNSNNFKLRNGHVNAGLYSGGHLVRDCSRSHTNIGSKVTDLPSGLY